MSIGLTADFLLESTKPIVKDYFGDLFTNPLRIIATLWNFNGLYSSSYRINNYTFQNVATNPSAAYANDPLMMAIGRADPDSYK